MIREFFRTIRDALTREKCYGNMVRKGLAAYNDCPGLIGASSPTWYLHEPCVNCKYLDHRVRHINMKFKEDSQAEKDAT